MQKKKKAFEKIQQTFIIEALERVELEGTKPNIVEEYHKPTANTTINGEELEAVQSKLG